MKKGRVNGDKFSEGGARKKRFGTLAIAHRFVYQLWSKVAESSKTATRKRRTILRRRLPSPWTLTMIAPMSSSRKGKSDLWALVVRFSRTSRRRPPPSRCKLLFCLVQCSTHLSVLPCSESEEPILVEKSVGIKKPKQNSYVYIHRQDDFKI